MQVFEELKTVQQTDLDNLNHVNNVRYVQWVQDVAEAHWESEISDHISNNFFWVLLEHHIYYHAPAVLDDVLKLKTYVTDSEGVKSFRTVEIYNEDTDQLLVKSETVWAFMSKSTGKPSRISAEVKELFK